MKYLVLLFLVIGCKVDERSGYDRGHAEDYLTGTFKCDTKNQADWGTEVYDCVDSITGKKEAVIINPSNVFIIKE